MSRAGWGLVSWVLHICLIFVLAFVPGPDVFFVAAQAALIARVVLLACRVEAQE